MDVVIGRDILPIVEMRSRRMASLGRMNEAFSIFQTLSSETGDSYTSKMHIPAYLQMLLFIVVTMVLLLRYFIQSAIHILPRSQYSDNGSTIFIINMV